MTRINLVPPSELHTKHLVAEYRELPRVFTLARHGAAVPAEYVLGAGHVTFFYDKLLFLANRFTDLVKEMQRRGYKPTIDAFAMWGHHPQNGGSMPLTLFNDYTPTPKALALNRERLKQRQPKGVK